MLKTIEDGIPITEEQASSYKQPILEGLLENNFRALLNMKPYELNTVTTLPMPTHEDWQTATDLDPDLNKVITTLKDTQIPLKGWEDHGYIAELRGKRLELDDGVLYRYEASARRSLRQVRAKVVPKTLRATVIAACHALSLIHI